MTLGEFCQPGRAEALKALVHISILALAGGSALYNAAALCVRTRPEPHLARNVLLYTVLGVIEWHQVQRHRRATC